MGLRHHVPLDQRGPLRTLFLITSMPVGGAEVLLADLVRGMDRRRVVPQICCLKEPGPLGEQLASQVPLHSQMTRGKYDLGVLRRLRQLMRQQQIDATITVGAGDKMFWGRLAAYQVRVPVIAAALHSTGWPDCIGRLNRWLTPITDAFIAVAEPHGRHLAQVEGFPEHKVHVIPNGIDTEKFVFDASARARWRRKLGIPLDCPVCGIVAALRPEKNHQLFLEVAARVARRRSQAHFVIAGDGPCRERLVQAACQHGISERVHFLGTCGDIPGVLSMLDLFSLTSHNEANPVSILEAMSCARIVVAPRVGSIDQIVVNEETGYVMDGLDVDAFARHWLLVLSRPDQHRQMAAEARRRVVETSSLGRMVEGYQQLIESIYSAKIGQFPPGRKCPADHCCPPISQPLHR